MGGYVDSGKCLKCGGEATASADWKYGEKVELVECTTSIVVMFMR